MPSALPRFEVAWGKRPNGDAGRRPSVAELLLDVEPIVGWQDFFDDGRIRRPWLRHHDVAGERVDGGRRDASGPGELAGGSRRPASRASNARAIDSETTGSANDDTSPDPAVRGRRAATHLGRWAATARPIRWLLLQHHCRMPSARPAQTDRRGRKKHRPRAPTARQRPREGADGKQGPQRSTITRDPPVVASASSDGGTDGPEASDSDETERAKRFDRGDGLAEDQPIRGSILASVKWQHRKLRSRRIAICVHPN